MAAINIKTTTKVVPQCYAYTTPDVPKHDGWTKIGFTERDVETRINEQTHTLGVDYKLCWAERASYQKEPYGTFTDRQFHAYLKRLGVKREPGTEWFFIEPDDARDKFVDYTKNHGIVSEEEADAPVPYILRDEQADAVEKTAEYFKDHQNDQNAKFLWNAKPRFGKTLSAYELCDRLGARKILIITNRPAIANSWYQDYKTFFGPQSGYLFVSNVDAIKDEKFVLSREEFANMPKKDIKGCIEFVSLQDLKGSLYFGGHTDKLAEVSNDEKKE